MPRRVQIMATAGNVDVAQCKRDFQRSNSLLKTEEAALDVLLELDSYLDAEISTVRNYLANSRSDKSGSNCSPGNASVCEQCRGKDPSKGDQNHSLSLQINTALRNGHGDCLREILRNSPSLLRETPNSESSHIHLACELGHADVLDVLVRHELDDPETDGDNILTVKDPRGRCPLHVAAHHGSIECVQLMMGYAGEGWQNIASTDGRTAVHYAAAGGNANCLQQLGKDCKDINVRDGAGKTSVYHAVENGHLECLQWLLENTKSDPRLVAKDGSMPLHAAAESGHLQCVHWLVRRICCSLATPRNTDSATPLHLAAGKGRVKVIQWALQQNLSTGSEIDRRGRTPAHYAALNGQFETLQVFLKFQEVDMAFEDNDGQTPRDLAMISGHEDCSSLLSVVPLPQRKRGSLVNRLTRSLSGPARTERSSFRRTKERTDALRRNANNNARLSVHYLDLNGEYNRKQGLTAYLEEYRECSTASMIAQAGLVPLFAACPDENLHATLRKVSPPTLFKKL
ncbi:uncharacterized protein LOC144435327 [Glandiceps talaboti]